jgi:hypothetical protein
MISQSIVVWVIFLLALRRCAHLGLCLFPDLYHRSHRVLACHQFDVHIIIAESDGKRIQAFEQIIRPGGALGIGGLAKRTNSNAELML